MKNRRYSRSSMDRISELPQGILQRILYFLSQKEAVRTAVLSKSWRHIWCTRPNLDFSDRNFKGNTRELLSVVDKTLQRYCDQRLCLEEFRLFTWLQNNMYSVSFLEKWIPLLTTMGVKDFRLSIWSLWGPGFTDLPSVVFEAKSLKDLELQRFKLDKQDFERIVLCKHLRSLLLSEVYIEDEIFQKIISNCPSIETIHVRQCHSLRIIRLNDLHHNFKSFSFELKGSDPREICSIEIRSPSLIETIKIRGANICLHKGADFRNLKDLSLFNVKTSLDHLSSSKFPSLQFLKFSDCDGLKVSQLLFIDAPNIRSFKYGGSFVPSISFETTSNKWKSNIYLHSSDASSSLFLKLHELLKSLSKSEISLTIDRISSTITENIMVQDNGYNNKPIIVESLTLSRAFPSLVNGVFAICRPINISNHRHIWGGIESTGFLWKILMERENGDKADQLRRLLCRDLEDVSFEMKEEDREEWRPALLSDLLVNYGHLDLQFRFALKWRETLCEIK